MTPTHQREPRHGQPLHMTWPRPTWSVSWHGDGDTTYYSGERSTPARGDSSLPGAAKVDVTVRLVTADSLETTSHGSSFVVRDPTEVVMDVGASGNIFFGLDDALALGHALVALCENAIRRQDITDEDEAA